MLTAQQESTLTSGGDSFDHYHSEDRRVTQQTVRDLQNSLTQSTAGAVYSITASDDLVLCPDVANITLPLSKLGRMFYVVRTGAGLVTCTCSGTDLIYGAASTTLTALGESKYFVAIPGGWVLL